MNTRVIKTKVDEFSKLIKQQFENNSKINYVNDINKSEKRSSGFGKTQINLNKPESGQKKCQTRIFKQTG